MEKSQSITTAQQTPTEPSAQSSWVSLAFINPDELDAKKWRRIAELLKPALDGCADTDLIDILHQVKRGEATLWGLVDSDRVLLGAIVCAVLQYATGYTVLHVKACAIDTPRAVGANRRAVAKQLEQIAEFAECDAVRIVGRPGWGKALPDYVEVHRTWDKIIRRES